MPDDSYVSRCPRCNGFVQIRLDGICCVVCDYFSPKRNPLDDLPEIRKTGESFSAPHRLPHPSTKGQS